MTYEFTNEQPLTLEKAQEFIGKEIDVTIFHNDEGGGGLVEAVLMPDGTAITKNQNPELDLTDCSYPTVDEGPTFLFDWGWGISISSIKLLVCD